MRRRVVITGIGAVCPLGNTAGEVSSAWQRGTVAFRAIEAFANLPTAIHIGAPVTGFDSARHFAARDARMLGRASQFALVAAREALDQSALLEASPDRDAIGVVLGVAAGDVAATEAGYADLWVARHPQVSPNTIPMAMVNAPNARVSMAFGLRGASYTISTACASATHAIGEAAWKIAHGLLDAAVTGGTDACLVWGVWKGWEALRVMDPEGCRPFSADRRGMTLGEGAGILVLEERERAIARGARILGEIRGYAANADAHHITLPDQVSIGRVMGLALRDAALTAADIGFVAAHATGTVFNDRTETAALRDLFGGQAQCPPVIATKSLHGHLMGAAGAVETIIALQALDAGILPPTRGLRVRDPDCDLDYVADGPRQVRADFCLKPSFAFGGLNAALVLAGPPAALAEDGR